MTGLPEIERLSLRGSTVLLRCDVNVPLHKGSVADDFRLEAALPTIRLLRSEGAKVVVCSHLGRPKGFDPTLSLAPVGMRLAELGGFEVVTADDVAGDSAQRAVAAQRDEVVLLENTRFEAGETANDPAFAERLARLADSFVLDAFGSAHRAHASTIGVMDFLPAAAGPLLVAEVTAFERLLGHPERPFVVVLGGAKVSSKLGVMRTLLPKVDVMLVGGAMCFTILRAEGYSVGDSLVEPELEGEVSGVLGSPEGSRLTLPVDFVVADRAAPEAEPTVAPAGDIPDDTVGLDIGPKTAQRFAAILGGADTVFWNGPMGVSEWSAFASGTEAVARAVAESPAYTIVGGGDTVAAVRSLGLDDAMSHLSTGGGAGLELIEEGTLPALEALRSGRGS